MPNAESSPKTLADSANPSLRFIAKFTVLRDAMRELWIVFGIKLLVIAAYGLANSTLVLWFSADFGYSDQKALALVAAWSLAMSTFTVLAGSLTDAIGYRNTFLWGVGLATVARGVMAFATNQWLALLGGLFPLAIGEALTGPVLVAAARTYSSTSQRSMSFSIIYSIMNVGFLVSNLLFDYFRKHLGEHGHFNVAGAHLSTYRVMILVSMLMECAIFPLIYCLREGAEATDEGVRINPKKNLRRHANMFFSAGLTLRHTAHETAHAFARLFRQTGFYRLMMFLILIAFLKFIYRQLDYVFPKFGIRVLGDGAPVGTLIALNNILVIVLAPIIGALTQRFSAYKMVIVGGIISATSVYFMALPPPWFAPLARGPFGDWLGHWYLGLTGAIDPVYVMSALFVVFLSFGEVLYSPRVYEYAAAIAPKGQEASYSALSYVPFLLAKLLTGTFSGTLLATYCPEFGDRRPWIMWLIIGLIATVAPLGLAMLSRVIRLREAGRAD